MQRQPVVPLALMGMLIIAATVYVSGHLSGLRTSVTELRDSLNPATTTVILKNEEGMKTGTLSKIINGTTIKLDYTWDCTPEGWVEILRLWKIICDNPPPE